MEVLKARQEQIGADLAKIERNVRALVARELECWRVGRWGDVARTGCRADIAVSKQGPATLSFPPGPLHAHRSMTPRRGTLRQSTQTLERF